MNPSSTITLVAVTQRGVEKARLLRRRLRTGELLRPARYGPSEQGWESTYDGALSDRIPEVFARSGQIVFFLAVGAAVRLIAPCLGSKETDPGVLVVDESGRFVIPLLGGHQGGANAFARTVAGCLGAVPVITTASDVIGGLSLDLLEDAFGWQAEPRNLLKPAARALVDGDPVAIVQEIGTSDSRLAEKQLPANVSVVRVVALRGREPAYVLWITDRIVDEASREGISVDRILWYRPKSLVLGVGCERGISAEALEDGLSRFLEENRYSRESIGTIASVELKADERGLIDWAARHPWQTVFFTAEELAAIGAPNPSGVVARCVGTPGVAEPAALLASGARQLLVEKRVINSAASPQRMTFALARFAEFEPRQPSRQTKVVFVSAGPGDPDLLTIKGRRMIAQADVIVYAGSLVPREILQHASPTAELHDSAPLTLEEVMERLIAAAQQGKNVVRIHSGDTSLYSAMQEQMTRLDEAGIEYEVIPGVSSFQAAAAALKAELTLPEIAQTVILTRTEGETRMPDGEALADLARHGSTLCIFLSARQVEQVQEQLLTAYSADTPVAVLYRVSWPDERIVRTVLSDLAATIRQHKLTRTTLIMVGKAVGSRGNRSRLYNREHGHIFRARLRDEPAK